MRRPPFAWLLGLLFLLVTPLAAQIGFAPKRLLVVYADGRVSLWDLKDRQVERSFQITQPVLAAFSVGRGKTLLAVSANGQITEWDVSAATLRRTVETITIVPIRDAVLARFNEDWDDDSSGNRGREWLAIALQSGQVIFSRYNDRRQFVLSPPVDQPLLYTALQFVPGSEALLAGTASSALVTWEVRNGGQRLTNPGSLPGVVGALQFDDRGRFLFAGGSNGVMIRFVGGVGGFANGQLAEDRRFVLPHGDVITDLHLSPTDPLAATGAANGTIILWNKLTTRLHLGGRTFRSPASVTRVRFSPNGFWFAAGDTAGNISLWESATGRPEPVLARGDGAAPFANPAVVYFSFAE